MKQWEFHSERASGWHKPSGGVNGMVDPVRPWLMSATRTAAWVEEHRRKIYCAVDVCKESWQHWTQGRQRGMAKVVEKFGLNNGELNCSASIEVRAVAIPCMEKVWIEILPNTWPFLCWSSAWSSGLYGVKVNVWGRCTSQAHQCLQLLSISSAPLLPHPQTSQRDVTPGTLWQNVTTPQPELLGSSPAHTVSILCVNGLVQDLSTTTQSVLEKFSPSLRQDPVALAQLGPCTCTVLMRGAGLRGAW